MAAISLRRGACFLGDEQGCVYERPLANDAPRVTVCRMRSKSTVRCILPADLLFDGGTDGLVVGDAAGYVTYFHGGIPVSEHRLPCGIAALVRHCSRDRARAVAAADLGGTVIVFGTPSQPHWRLRLQDVPALVRLSVMQPAAAGLISLGSSDSRQGRLLIAAGQRALLLVSANGVPMNVLEAPEEVTALADGSGSSSDDDQEREEPEADLTFAVVACAGGSVHSVPSMERLAIVGAHVTAVDAAYWGARGWLACCGYFDGVLVVARYGLLQHVLSSSGWCLCVRLLIAPAQLEAEDGDREPLATHVWCVPSNGCDGPSEPTWTCVELATSTCEEPA
jgi:hypothetical protein